jgi:hypothetical protein
MANDSLSDLPAWAPSPSSPFVDTNAEQSRAA